MEEVDEEYFSELVRFPHLSGREILDFRLSPLFPHLLHQLTKLSTSPESAGAYLNFLTRCCANYDFSYQFGDYGGHIILKQIIKNLPEFNDECYELISTIAASGCVYPMTKNILSQEEIMRPLIYQFTRQQDQGQGEGKDDREFTVILRQIPASMHGEGQIAVGYIIWSAALILSRWIAMNSSFFEKKLVLEIGAGTGLCGIVAGACGSSVVISDYTDIILKNIAENIRLNRKGTLCQGTEGCLDESAYAEVIPPCPCRVSHLIGLSPRLEHS
jgi:hypothetical protein